MGPQGSGRWGKVGRPCGALPQTMAFQSIVWAMCRVLAGSRKRVHLPGGAGGDKPGCWEGSPGAGYANSLCTIRGSAGGSWPGCSRGPWGMSPLLLVPCLSVSFGAALILLTHPFVSPPPETLAQPSQPGRHCGTAARLLQLSPFPSRLWFGVGALDGIWLFITLPDLRDLRRRFCRARCRSQMAEPGSEAALGPALQAEGAENLQNFNCSICTDACAGFEGLN